MMIRFGAIRRSYESETGVCSDGRVRVPAASASEGWEATVTPGWQLWDYLSRD